eukprot:m.87663 g.87663  ORF g.87663 m.87663 type:complete len:62 (-) comp13123_c1_seq3:1827-2012(-)
MISQTLQLGLVGIPDGYSAKLACMDLGSMGGMCCSETPNIRPRFGDIRQLQLKLKASSSDA